MHNLHTDVFIPYAKDEEEKTGKKVKVTVFLEESYAENVVL